MKLKSFTLYTEDGRKFVVSETPDRFSLSFTLAEAEGKGTYVSCELDKAEVNEVRNILSTGYSRYDEKLELKDPPPEKEIDDKDVEHGREVADALKDAGVEVNG
jgi:hypothetical protein